MIGPLSINSGVETYLLSDETGVENYVITLLGSQYFAVYLTAGALVGSYGDAGTAQNACQTHYNSL
jgi:hypothetical protein